MGLFKKNKICSPVNKGELKTLESLNDGVFSEKMMGNGFVIEHSDGKVYAPVSGKLISVFPTKHAYGIETNDGLNLLIHIGIDTVSLNGEGFKSFVEQGQEIKQGDLLVEVDTNFIKSKNIVTDVICVITPDSKISIKDKNIKISGNVSTNDIIAKY